MYYNIALLVVGIGSLVEEYLNKKAHDEQFCFTKHCFYESALLVNATICPTGERSKRGRGGRMTSDLKEHYRKALAKTETQI